MKVFNYVSAALLVIFAMGMADARTCWCNECGFQAFVTRRVCTEGSSLGWQYDSAKEKCLDVSVEDTKE
ncbi:hypothetical protein BGZ94_010139 [Podila epigama]|nr:hypothetical protein BGZ94_010139 [Podila epigama]